MPGTQEVHGHFSAFPLRNGLFLGIFLTRALVVLLVNDSEYSRSTGAKPILSLSCVYLVSPGALRASTPPRPPFWGEGSTKKENRLRRRWRLGMFASACAWWVLRDAMGMGHGVTRGIIERHAGAGVANLSFPLQGGSEFSAIAG